MTRRNGFGQLNSNWKGSQIGYAAQHIRMSKLVPKPELCQICGETKPHDLANISGQYLFDLTDWEWLCRRCHMRKDGRLQRFAVRKDMSQRVCITCGSDKTYTNPKSGQQNWRCLPDGNFQCKRCSRKNHKVTILLG